MTLRTSVCAVILCMTVASSCAREKVPHGRYAGPCNSLDLSSIPIVLVGTITSNKEVGQPQRVTSDHILAIYQWFRLGVHVENVLKGSITSRDVWIYYLTNIGPIGGPHRLGLKTLVPGGTWRIGDREMFFVWLDEDMLRTICDVGAIAVWPVYTGAHQTPEKPLPEAITDILLDRGPGSTDQDIINAMLRTLPFDLAEGYTIQKLRTLASTEDAKVRQQACDILRSLGQPCPP